MSELNFPTYSYTTTTEGSGTLTLTPPDEIQQGDLCVFAGAYRNSVPNSLGPNGGGWNRIAYWDTATSEYNAMWWKHAVGEQSWSLTQTGSGLVQAQVLRFPQRVGQPYWKWTDGGTVTHSMFAPAGSAVLHVWFSSYSDSIARPKDLFVIGEPGQQGADETVTMGWEFVPHAMTVSSRSSVVALAEANYRSTWTVVFPPIANLPDSKAR